jgi:hypothetical protein
LYVCICLGGIGDGVSDEGFSDEMINAAWYNFTNNEWTVLPSMITRTYVCHAPRCPLHYTVTSLQFTSLQCMMMMMMTQ